MPRAAKINKEMILTEAMKIVRNDGIDNLNVRNVAKGLECSTQPIMYLYKNMEELKVELYDMVDKYHSEYIGNITESDNPLIQIGLNYIKFASNEKNLFKFLFQSNKFANTSITDLIQNTEEELSFVLDIMQQEIEVSKDEAIQIFENIYITVHGMASLIANNSMAFDESYCIKKLEDSFFGSVMMIKGEEK